MDELKKLIQAMVISNANKEMTVAQLKKDFKYHEGYEIPYQDFGFKQLDAMLHTMSDVVKLRGQGPWASIVPVISQKNGHIRKMILNQKSSSNKSTPPSMCRTQNKRYGDWHSRQTSNNFSPHSDNGAGWDTGNYSCNSAPLGTSRSDEDWGDAFPDTTLKTGTAEWNPGKKAGNYLPGEQKMYKHFNAAATTYQPAKNIPRNNHEHKIETNSVRNLASPGIPFDAMTQADKLPVHNSSTLVRPGSIVKVIVDTVLSPAEMYVHLICDSEKLVAIAEDIEKMYGGMSTLSTSNWQPSETRAKVGLYCVVRYQNCWYRGMITGPVIDLRLKLSLVDYGYQLSNVALSDVRYMSKKFATLPPQSVRVSLAHVKPIGEWSDEATRYLSETTYNKVLNMYSVGNNTKDNTLDVVFIDTSTSTDAVLNSELVLKKYAKWMHAV